MRLKLYYTFPIIWVLGVIASACGGRGTDNPAAPLREELYRIADKAPGTVGIAVVSEKDTITINNGVRYAMMSVFKLHEALAVADRLASAGSTLDTLLTVKASELDHNTWSPMLKKYGDGDFTTSARELVELAITASDNNASNLLFDHIISPTETDAFIRSVAPDTTFAIRYSEADMKRDHSLSYLNYSSPLAAALLIRSIFAEQLTDSASQEFIKQSLTTVTTGQNRIGRVTEQRPDILFAHKTGSGYRNNAGELIAFNDIGYFRLPDGRDYALGVMIRDFAGTEDEAAELMAEISETLLAWMEGQR